MLRKLKPDEQQKQAIRALRSSPGYRKTLDFLRGVSRQADTDALETLKDVDLLRGRALAYRELLALLEDEDL